MFGTCHFQYAILQFKHSNFERKHAVHRRHLEPSAATHASEDGRKVRNGMEFVPRVEISIFCTKKKTSHN